MDRKEMIEAMKDILNTTFKIVLDVEKANNLKLTRLQRREIAAELLTRLFNERDMEFDWSVTLLHDSMKGYYKDATTY